METAILLREEICNPDECRYEILRRCQGRSVGALLGTELSGKRLELRATRPRCASVISLAPDGPSQVESL